MSSMATRILRFRIFEAVWQNLGDFILMRTQAPNGIVSIHYADDTTLMAESEGELKSLLMKVKVESEKLA